MKLSKFRYELPSDFIASHPNENRDESRLMVVHRDTGDIEHRMFKDVIEYFEEGDLLVGNDTMVFPAKLHGTKEKTGAHIEVFLLRELNSDMHLWDVLVDPARKIRVGNKLYFGSGKLAAEVIDNTTSRGRTIRFIFDDSKVSFSDLIEELGETPLPNHIPRKVESSDKYRFQTIYAKNKGAVIAPTAGLHFTKQLIKRLEIKGVKMTFLTLHIGLGTFRQVEVEDLTKHKIDSEIFRVSKETADQVNQTLSLGKRVCAVGTTSMRALESAISASNKLKAFEGWTDKFIFPPYDFKICNAMITNFHIPRSTMLMMAAAFGGYEHVIHAYEVAKKEKYKFLTYGDAMLIV